MEFFKERKYLDKHFDLNLKIFENNNYNNNYD